MLAAMLAIALIGAPVSARGQAPPLTRIFNFYKAPAIHEAFGLSSHISHRSPSAAFASLLAIALSARTEPAGRCAACA